MLTPQQQQAVDAPADRHVVLEACAGSGKTTTLGARIHKLITEDHIDPGKIVVATFSKSQADDMALRIFAKYPELKSTPLKTGFGGTGQILTLHALARRMVVTYYPEWAQRQLAPTYKERKIIEELVETLRWTINDKPVGWESVLFWINKFKGDADENENLRPFDKWTIGEWAESCLGQRAATLLAEVATSYQIALDRANMWTFADMMRVCELRMNDDEKFRTHWRAQFSHILVDEGQDTAANAMRILYKLQPAAIFITGDGDQTLYRFLMAEPEINLRRGFDRRYGENGLRLWMTRNFRSQPTILDRANRLIHNNYDEKNEKFKKTLECGAGGEGPDLTWDWFVDAQSEAIHVCNEIQEQIEKGNTKPGQYMIMGRLNAQNAQLEIELLRRKLSFVNLGNGSFFDQGVARTCVAYMQVALDPSNQDAFESVYNIASRDMSTKNGKYCATRWLGREFLDRVRGSTDLIKATYEHRFDKDARGWSRWRDGALDLVNTFEQLQQFSAEDSAVSMIRALRTLVLDKWIDDQYGVETDAAGSVHDDLAIIMEIAGTFNVGEFLEYAAALKKTQGVKPEDLTDYILIGTVYRFKGLERDIVYIVGLSDGLLPHAFATGDAAPKSDGLPIPNTTTIESERNVAFVAVTRAKRECHCSGIENWPTRKEAMVPSRFCREMDILPDEEDEETEMDEETFYKFDPIGSEEYE